MLTTCCPLRVALRDRRSAAANTTTVLTVARRSSARALRVRAAAPQPASSSNSYGDLTQRLVGFSSLPFTFIVVPQVLQNAANIAAGQLSALASISWVGWCAGLAGNVLMCAYLASKREATAVNVQLIGIASNLVVLGQLWYAGVMPTRAFAGVVAAAFAIAAASAAQARGALTERQWLPFEAMAGALGVASAPQVCGHQQCQRAHASSEADDDDEDAEMQRCNGVG